MPLDKNIQRKAAKKIPAFPSPELKEFLNRKVEEYERPFFIESDPISIPHQFSRLQDIEIAGFFAALFAWGNRQAILKKARELMQLMDMAPYEFVLRHSPEDLKKLVQFKHRTFNPTDILYFVSFLNFHYSTEPSLETAFTKWMMPGDENVEKALTGFYHYFFSLEDAPERTRKHIATPEKKSTCKRLNMYLRWMVRSAEKGVDFGIWKNIDPAQLICPIDVHVARVAKHFQLLNRDQIDWKAALDLTAHLRTMNPADPASYDFALFGLGVMEKY